MRRSCRNISGKGNRKCKDSNNVGLPKDYWGKSNLDSSGVHMLRNEAKPYLFASGLTINTATTSAS